MRSSDAVAAAFIDGMPKAELHVHLEGTLEPAMLLRLADANGVDLPFADETEIVAAQDYPDPALEHFLEYHYRCLSVLGIGRDFYELTYEFLRVCGDNNVVHVEISFDPQAHLSRGLRFGEFFEAIESARYDGSRDHDVSALLIMCIQRDRSAAEAFSMLDEAAPYRDSIAGLGIDSFEKDNPPIKFVDTYRRARDEGYRLTAHCDCDQENSVQHIWQCVDGLGVERIDHGVHVLDDPDLVEAVVARRIPFTMCPTWRPSDPEPRRLEPIKRMLDLDIPVSVNSDDPAEFASRYLSHMLTNVQDQGGFSNSEMVQLMRNAFEAAWVPTEQRDQFLARLDDHASAHAVSP